MLYMWNFNTDEFIGRDDSVRFDTSEVAVGDALFVQFNHRDFGILNGEYTYGLITEINEDRIALTTVMGQKTITAQNLFNQDVVIPLTYYSDGQERSYEDMLDVKIRNHFLVDNIETGDIIVFKNLREGFKHYGTVGGYTSDTLGINLISGYGKDGLHMNQVGTRYNLMIESIEDGEIEITDYDSIC